MSFKFNFNLFSLLKPTDKDKVTILKSMAVPEQYQ